jgi:hypothetical protein
VVLAMKRRLFFALLIVAAVLLALSGWALAALRFASR